MIDTRLHVNVLPLTIHESNEILKKKKKNITSSHLIKLNKKIKNMKGIKRHKRRKGNIKQLEVMFAHLIKGYRLL